MEGLKFSLATVALATLVLVAGGAAANPAGVPVEENPPRACQTESQGFTVTAVPDAQGRFPKSIQCGSETCSEYRYRVVSTLNIDHTVISVSATQKIDFSRTSGTAAVPFRLGDPDTTTGFLANAVHEYPVRFNASNSKSVEWVVVTEGTSQARVGTILIRSGTKRTEKCLIATPGFTATAAIDEFQPVYVTQKLKVAGGKCLADLIYDEMGVLVDVQVAQENTNSSCRAGSPSSGVVLVNGEPLRNNSGPLGITFGNGTTTCYGPPVPSIPRCICTAAPCP